MESKRLHGRDKALMADEKDEKKRGKKPGDGPERLSGGVRRWERKKRPVRPDPDALPRNAQQLAGISNGDEDPPDDFEPPDNTARQQDAGGDEAPASQD